MSVPNPFWAKPHPDSVDDSDENGVYAITKKTDYWFNREPTDRTGSEAARRRMGGEGICRATTWSAPAPSSPNRCSA